MDMRLWATAVEARADDDRPWIRGPVVFCRSKTVVSSDGCGRTNHDALDQTNAVSERVDHLAVNAIRGLGQLLRELNPAGRELSVHRSAIDGCQQRAPTNAFRENALHEIELVRRQHRGRVAQNQLHIGLTGRVDREPSHESEIVVVADDETKLADIKLQSFVLIENPDVAVRNSHVHDVPFGW